MNVLVLGFFLTTVVYGGWTPADDGPLPLSQEYRDKLAQICKIIDEGGQLPTGLREKETLIRANCQKLKEAESYSTGEAPAGISSLLLALGVGGVLYYLMANRKPATPSSSQTVTPLSPEEKEKIRAARLAQFGAQ